MVSSRERELFVKRLSLLRIRDICRNVGRPSCTLSRRESVLLCLYFAQNCLRDADFADASLNSVIPVKSEFVKFLS